MRVSIFVGDVADAEADAVCTSTNPRLSLMMGTGASIRERGGFEILRACEEIIRHHRSEPLPPGTAHVTTAGSLPHKIAIHCVASDAAHRSADAIIEACVASALRCAEDRGCRSVAMPIFGTGHAHADFSHALELMAATARRAQTSVEHITFVILDPERVKTAKEILERAFAAPVSITTGEPSREESFGWPDYQ